jgi:hypothetical protein
LNGTKNNLTGESSLGYKFGSGAVNFGPVLFDFELKSNDIGFKSYFDLTKVPQGNTKYVMPIRINQNRR